LQSPDKLEERPKKVLETLVLLLAPYAPHVAEELWAALGHSTTLAYESWPTFDPALTVADTIEVPVQCEREVAGEADRASGLDAAGLEAAAKADEAIQAQIAGKTLKKVIVVPGKLCESGCFVTSWRAGNVSDRRGVPPVTYVPGSPKRYPPLAIAVNLTA